MPLRLPFFKSRDSEPAAVPQRESVELMRKRARHRLIGAAVLVLIGVIGFPLLFDTQPRPIAVDIAIEIPDKNSVKPLVMPAVPDAMPARTPASGPVAAAPATPAAAPKVAASASLANKEEIVAPAPKPAAVPPAPAAAAKPEAKPEPKAGAGKPEAKAPDKAEALVDDGARAKALLNGQASEAAAAGERFVVQAGAFADAAKARETRLKLEKAGLKTYTQVAQTKDGSRIRVRVGPFASRAEAERALARIKALDLSAAILTL